jgi:hypothetical protein
MSTTCAERILANPIPIRLRALRFLDRRFDFLPYQAKLNYNIIERPHYGHCLLQAALLAKKLGHSWFSAIEFGVAGGNGLMALEAHAEYVKRETGVNVAIYGFDTGNGMPSPLDYRDLPYLWQSGDFRMDPEKLKMQLTRAKLILGPVGETVAEFCHSEMPPPIGFIAFDLDYYSSTAAAFQIFEQESVYLLPRVVCYFDDVVGDVDWAYNEFTGELLAIKEFNETHNDTKLAPVQGLRFGQKLPQLWHEQIFVAHLFKHADYCRPISALTQLPLAAE